MACTDIIRRRSTQCFLIWRQMDGKLGYWRLFPILYDGCFTLFEQRGCYVCLVVGAVYLFRFSPLLFDDKLIPWARLSKAVSKLVWLVIVICKYSEMDHKKDSTFFERGSMSWRWRWILIIDALKRRDWFDCFSDCFWLIRAVLMFPCRLCTVLIRK